MRETIDEIQRDITVEVPGRARQGFTKARTSLRHALVGSEREHSEGPGTERVEAGIASKEGATAREATGHPDNSVISFLRANAWFAVVAVVAASLTAGAFILGGRRKEEAQPMSLTAHATQRAAEVGHQAAEKSRDVASEVKKALRGTAGKIAK